MMRVRLRDGPVFEVGERDLRLYSVKIFDSANARADVFALAKSQGFEPDDERVDNDNVEVQAVQFLNSRLSDTDFYFDYHEDGCFYLANWAWWSFFG